MWVDVGNNDPVEAQTMVVAGDQTAVCVHTLVLHCCWVTHSLYSVWQCYFDTSSSQGRRQCSVIGKDPRQTVTCVTVTGGWAFNCNTDLVLSPCILLFGS
ncbi:hypothetical protein J6590_052604 [Homalodisca vitripennis]|nr:hypothetical protein J6590_052604 [Homalodisca vitripennis]